MVGLALTVLLVIAALWLFWPRQPKPVDDASADVGEATPARSALGPTLAAAIEPAGSARPVSGLAAADADLLARWQASSLRGTEVDGELRFDGVGQLMLDAGLRQLLDHFLSLTGEFSASEIRRLLQLHVAGTHGDTATSAVLAAFDRYVAMRAALAVMPPVEDLAARFALISTVREQWFGDAANRMFADEISRVEYTLSRMAIQRDADLDPAVREELLAELDASRPALERVSEETALSGLLAEEQSRQLDAINADPVARFQERSDLWGEEAAERLARLDQARQQWDQRLIDYVRQRDAIHGSAHLDAAARQAAIDALRRRSFSGVDLVRVESLEAVGALPGG